MLFDDFPFPDYDGTGDSFVPHQNVLRYIEDFAQPIRHFILVRAYLITLYMRILPEMQKILIDKTQTKDTAH